MFPQHKPCTLKHLTLVLASLQEKKWTKIAQHQIAEEVKGKKV